MASQQHKVEVLKDLTDLKEKLLDPKFKLENVLAPKVNTRIKGRKPNSKRTAIALELYEATLKKKNKIEKAAERRKEESDKIAFKKEKQMLEESVM